MYQGSQVGPPPPFPLALPRLIPKALYRSSSCTHESRPLFEIKKKGRPVTQCVHCRELRKTKQVHVKCLCEVKPEQSTVTPILLGRPALQPITRCADHTFAAPDHSILSATGSCSCKDKSQEGTCTCWTPRHPSAKHSQQAGGELEASPGLGTHNTIPHRPHVSSPESGHDGLQRSSSLSAGHSTQQQHHTRHFAPYRLPSRSPPPDNLEITLGADSVPTSRNRSQSSASHPEFDRATTAAQFVYSNPTRTTSNPDLPWLTPPTLPPFTHQTSSPGDEKYRFDLSELNYPSNERVHTLQLSMNSQDSQLNSDQLAIPRKPTYPLPQLRLDDAQAPRDSSALVGLYAYETLADTLATPQPAHQLSPFSSGPSSMSGSTTSRSSSRNSGGRRPGLLEGADNVNLSEDEIRGRSGRQDRAGSATSRSETTDSRLHSQFNESPMSYLPKSPNSYDQLQYPHMSWPPIPEPDGVQPSESPYSFGSGDEELTIMAGSAMSVPIPYTDYPDGFFSSSFDQFSLTPHNSYTAPFYSSFSPSLPWSD